MTYRHQSRRKPVFGVGINDADYVVCGKHGTCPYYKAWQNMLKRCYCDSYQAKQPTYVGCTVCDEWLSFSVFRAWMEKQDWRGKELDKDILVPGNRVYSPETCLFVTRQINSLLNVREPSPFPQGVYFDVSSGKFRAEFTANGKKTYIGVFRTPREAGIAYKRAKAKHITKVAMSQPPRLRVALLRHSEALAC